jgi:hypothetical protein
MAINVLYMNRRKVIKLPVRLVHRPHAAIARHKRGIETALERIIDAASASASSCMGVKMEAIALLAGIVSGLLAAWAVCIAIKALALK